jgi:3',5'-cyclic-AMP phosphodiesterase
MNRRGFLKWLLALTAGAAVVGAGFFTRWKPDSGDDSQAGTSPQTAPDPATPEPQPAVPGGPLLSFFILSDLHVNSGFAYPSEHLEKAFDEITGPFVKQTDCIVITGDVTESGTDKDYKELRSVLSKYKLPPYYANMGNHDYYRVWIDSSGNWNQKGFPNGRTDEQSKQAFLDFFKLEKPYYDIRVKDHLIIMLSQEIYQQTRSDVGEGAWYSDEQLEWLSSKLAENKGGKPVFIMIHQPLPAAGQDGGSHRLIRAKRFREILKPYANVFVFSGHGHQDFQNGTEHYMKESFHWFVNSSTGRVLNAKYEHERKDAAQGLYVQVFEDRVELKGREFSTGEWIKEADWKVKLQSAKV